METWGRQFNVSSGSRGESDWTTAPISKQVFHDDIQEEMVGDGQFRNASPKGGWFLKKFQITTLAENTDVQHADSRSRKHGSFRFHVAGVPLQSCFCAVTRRVLWTGQRAGGVCTPSVIVDGSVKNDPNDLQRRKAMFKSPGSIWTAILQPNGKECVVHGRLPRGYPMQYAWKPK